MGGVGAPLQGSTGEENGVTGYRPADSVNSSVHTGPVTSGRQYQGDYKPQGSHAARGQACQGVPKKYNCFCSSVFPLLFGVIRKNT